MLQLNNCQIKSRSLKGLENSALQLLFLPKTHIGAFQKKQPGYCANLWYYYKNSPTEVAALDSLNWYWMVQNTPPVQRAIALHLLTQNHTQLAKISTLEQVLAFTDLTPSAHYHTPALRRRAIEYATQNSPSLHSNAQLTLIGSIEQAEETLWEHLKAVGVTGSRVWEATTSHVLLGEQPASSYTAALARNLPFVSEKQVLEYLHSNGDYYLMQEPALVENIEQLLLNQQEDTILLAVTMLDQGGFSPNLLEPLYYACFTAQTTELQEQLLVVLQRYSSVTIATSARTFIEGYRSRYFYAPIKVLHALRDTELNIPVLADLFYKNGKISFAHLLSLVPVERGVAYLQEHLKGGVLNLERKGFNSVPLCLYQLQTVEVLHLQHNNLKSIPIERLQQLPKLQKIDIRGNTRLIHNNNWRQRLSRQLPRLVVEDGR